MGGRAETVADKAGEQYWSSVWKQMQLPPPINPADNSLANHLNISFHRTFKKLLNGFDLTGKSLLEVGCGNSVWLPYFAKEYRVKPFGLDYSKHGCEQAEAILKREMLHGEIYHADMFSPPEHLNKKFDIVVSLGVVEHFTDTVSAIRALNFFLKPGGLLLTSIPNHAGLLGWLQKTIHRQVYDIHVILDKKMLVDSIETAGLKNINSTYLPGCSFYVNMDVINKRPELFGLKKCLAKCAAITTKLFWILEKIFGRIPPSKAFSPAILSLAEKPK
jgi:2-polyprenyl-3-methyl-5-hydroxy-6-metoxy-1,4-benzoquinol methylase